MLNSREAYQQLLEKPELDSLLDRAKEQTAKLSTASTDELAQAAEEVSRGAANARQNLLESIYEKQALRSEKVAIVQHMIRVGSRLSA